MATMDIFNTDAFSMVSLTTALNKEPFKPEFLGGLGIFNDRPVRTVTVAVEKKDNTLSLIQTSERGAPLDERTAEKRDVRDFRTRRIAKGATVYADEIQNIRAFGSETELMQVQTEIADRGMRIRRDIELTWENMRLGAIQGIVNDADGSVIYNWFTEWGIAQPSEIDFDLDNASPATGAVRKKCTEVVRAIMRNLKGAGPLRRIYGLCGDNFWDDLTAHSEVRATYLNQLQAQQLREGVAFETLNFGGITFINYRGTDDNSTVSVSTNSCKFFPDAPGVFDVAYSPAETFDYANTPGMPVYMMTIPDRDRNAWVRVEEYSYPLFICTRPETLQRAKRT